MFYPEDFNDGDKVWFHGLKAKVLEQTGYEIFYDGIVESDWDGWAVPIQIKGSKCVTIAHVDDLVPRK